MRPYWRYWIILKKIKKMKNKGHLLSALIIFLAGATIYANSLNSPFVFDDIHTIVDNPHIRSLRDISLFFSSTSTATSFARHIVYRPLTMLSFALSYRISGLKPWSYHLVNILLHCLNGIVVYFLVFLLIQPYLARPSLIWRFSLISSLVFLTHPINTEAVNYLVCRSELQSSLFFLLSLVLFVNFRRKGFPPGPAAKSLYRASLISFAFALLSKEMAISLPVVLLVYELTLRPRLSLRVRGSRPLRYHLPFWLLSLLYLLLRSYLLGGFLFTTWLRPLGVNLLTQAKVILGYLRLLALPLGLSLEHDVSLVNSLGEWSAILSLGVIFALIILGIKLSRKQRFVPFFIFWFFITLSPTYIVPLFILMNEHRLYIPGIGFAVTLTWAISNIRPKYLMALALGFILLTYSFLTVLRNKDWQDEAKLWKKTIQVNPSSARAFNNLGVSLSKEGKYAQAEEAFRTALKLEARYGRPHGGLGFIMYKRGNPEGAIEEYKQALRLNPYLYEARLLLGQIYEEKGLIEEAKNEYQTVIKHNPYYLKAHLRLGDIFEREGKLDLAQISYEHLIRLDPNDPQAHYRLGIVYGKKGDPRAIEEFKRAIDLNPNFAPAHYNLAISYLALSEPEVELAKRHLEVAEKLGYQLQPYLLERLQSFPSDHKVDRR
jgi:tetratricopeptide (TPR) repeat protein